jgi:tetratricopeptide (TPR) repeat protein
MRDLMNRFFFACVFTMAGILLSGCESDAPPVAQQPPQACVASASAVAENSGEVDCLLAEAELLVALNKPAEALNLLQSNTSLFEHNGAIRDEIGQILFLQKRYADAIAVLREATILANDDSTIREHLAFALLSNKQYGEAVDLFAKLVQEPNYEKRADVQAALGQCQAQANRLREAQASYELATHLAPDCAGYWIGLAEVQVQSDDLADAESAIRRAMAIDPSAADAQCLLGYVCLKANQLPESLAAFHAAADLDPTDSVSVSLQGYVLTRMGRQGESQPFYEKALAINPHDELATRLMAGADSHD